MSHRLLTAAAARLTGAASPSAIAASAAAPLNPAPAAAAPAAGTDGGEAVVDVVTLTDAHAAVAAAETRGAEAERARTSAVLKSDAGKANPQMAAFMLTAAPSASAESIIAQLGEMPAGSAPAAGAAAPAPAAGTAAPAPAAAAPTPGAAAGVADLNQTPTIDVGAAANQAGAEGMSEADATKFWDTQMTGVAASASPFGGDIAPGIPRTGN